VRLIVACSETEARAPDEVGKLGVRFIGWELLPQTLIYELLNTVIVVYAAVISYLTILSTMTSPEDEVDSALWSLCWKRLELIQRIK